MIVIPTGTDAPIYHWPYATVALIVLNTALLLRDPAGGGQGAAGREQQGHRGRRNRLELRALSVPTVGDGRLHPAQWVTHNFLHFGIIHLMGNMVFLVGLRHRGQGKLGAIKYLLTYVAIGTLHGAFVQSCYATPASSSMRPGRRRGLRAARRLHGLPPRNELNCVVISSASARWFTTGISTTRPCAALYRRTGLRTGLLGNARRQGDDLRAGHLSGAFLELRRGGDSAQGRPGRLRRLGPVRALEEATAARPGLEERGRRLRRAIRWSALSA